MSKEKDVQIAVDKFGWYWENRYGVRNILVPPDGDPRQFMTAKWDENGVPHFLPKYSEGGE